MADTWPYGTYALKKATLKNKSFLGSGDLEIVKEEDTSKVTIPFKKRRPKTFTVNEKVITDTFSFSGAKSDTGGDDTTRYWCVAHRIAHDSEIVPPADSPIEGFAGILIRRRKKSEGVYEDDMAVIAVIQETGTGEPTP